MLKGVFIIFLVLINFPIEMNGIKVKERFRPVPHGFVMKAVSQSFAGSNLEDISEAQMLKDVASTLFLGLNVTFVQGDLMIGFANETTCQYDGIIGVVQRNESHVLWALIRLDELGCDPGHVIPIQEVDDSPKIYSYKPVKPETEMVDILNIFTNFDSEIWFFIFISLFLVSVIFVSIKVILFESLINVKTRIKLFISTWWNYFLLFIDLAPDSILKPFQSSMVLWTALCAAGFYGIHMVLMGTLSTDLTVSITPRSIEYLKDLLYDPMFNATIPVIFKTWNMFNVLKRSKEGTDEKVLFDKIMSNANESILGDIDGGDPYKNQALFNKVIDDVSSGRVAIIENSVYVYNMARNGACYFKPEWLSNLQSGKEVLKQSMLGALVSHHTPEVVRENLYHRLLLLEESFVPTALSYVHACTIMQSYGLPVSMSVKSIVCIEKMEKSFRQELVLPWEPLGVIPYERLIDICLWQFAFSLAILVWELLFHYQESFHTVRRNKMTIIRY